MFEAEYRRNQKCLLFLLPDKSAAKFLDIGCGDGNFTIQIARVLRTDEAYGMDIDAKACHAAKEAGLRFNSSDANQPFPFSDASFDIITANQLIEHLSNIENFFLESRRVLKTGGWLIVSTPNLCSWHTIGFLLLGMQPASLHLVREQVGNFLRGSPTQGHLRLFSISAIRDIARLYGFKVEKLIGSGYYPFPGFLSGALSSLDKAHAVYLVVKMVKI